MITNSSSSAAAPSITGLAMGICLVVAGASASADALVVERPLGQSQRIHIESPAAAIHEHRGLGAELTEHAQSLTPANRARALRVAELAEALTSEITGGRTDGAELASSWDEAGTLSVEWMLHNRRIGFKFRRDETKSSWFIASMPPSKVDGSGYLRDIDISLVLFRGIRG